MLEQLELRGRRGYTSLTAEELAGFRPARELELPDRPYLLVAVDPDDDTHGTSPSDALPVLTAGGRSPLTLEEGLLHPLLHPDVLPAGTASRCSAHARTASASRARGS